MFECTENGRLSVCRITFGAEPKDGEVYEFIMKNYYRLVFSPAVEIKEREVKPNPKRIQREVHRQMSGRGVGTKAQQALKLQYEQMKLEKKSSNREKRQMQQQRQFELRQKKRKEKHRGR